MGARLPLSFLTTTLAAMLAAATLAAQRAPFDDLRWNDGRPEVEVDGSWYEVLAIDGVETDAILRFSKREHGPLWDKRFCEDLVDLLEGMGHRVADTVDLRVRELEGGAERTLEDVAMTRERRRRLWERRPRAGGSGGRPAAAAAHEIERPRAGTVDPRYAGWLTDYGTGRRMSGDAVAADLDELEWLLENVFSYATHPDLGVEGFDHRAALDTIRLRSRDGTCLDDLHIALRRVVASFGDGHSRVRGVFGALPRGCMPCALRPLDGRLVAIGSGGLLDAERPFVLELDGEPAEAWVEAAKTLAARGSSALQLHDAALYLPFVTFLRDRLGLEHLPEARLTLVDGHGRRPTTVALPLAERPRMLRRAFEVPELPAGIGYLRIRSMNHDAEDAERLRDELRASLAGNDRLVIDVRGNGGGTRVALRALLPFFLPPREGPRVVNVARYRIPPDVLDRDPARGFLDDRYAWPADAPVWSGAERRAIARLARRFAPDWQPQDEIFSDWHHMVVSPSEDPDDRFEGPVAILIDEGCFSATDIFVGGFEILPAVVLVGTPTGGGSGRSREYRLPSSGLRVRLSSMASFRPTGASYDGKGIEPDVHVTPTVPDLLGETDSQLEAAVRALGGGR